MLHVRINQQEHEFPDGVSILSAIRQVGLEVPTLCNDSRILPTGACRLCSVEIEGQDRLAAACTTPLAEGMSILTHSDATEADRRTNLRLLAANYPANEPLDDHIEFHRYLKHYGIEPSGARSGGFKDFDHPYIQVDMDKCVHCYRCVRICNELQGQFVWRVWNRGDRTEIRPDKGDSLLSSSCVSCGACADTCPSGAIQDRLVVERGQPTSWTRTTCAYCGTGCEMEVGVRDGEVIVARPVKDAPVNKGHLCVKGRYAHRFAHAKDRVTEPMIRIDGTWKEVSWDEAYAFIGSRLKSILQEHGPSAIGVLGSSRATNEENYFAQKFARVVIGSNNVDCCARVCHAPSASALKSTLGTGASTNSFNDIELAHGFMICGANPTENHPIVGARIKQQVLKGAQLVVVDPRKTELAQLADVHLQIRPGTNIPTFHAIAHAILVADLCDHEFIVQRTQDLEGFRAFLAEWTPERAAQIAGVSADDIRKAAKIYATAKPAMIFHGLGMTEHTQGTEGVRCLVNLALLTGNLGKPGSGENPLRGQNNVQGSAHMGCEPSNLAGYTPIETSAPLFEEVWGVPIPREPGLNWMKMLDASVAGSLKALYAIGYDVYFSSPNAKETAEGLRKLDLLVIQDIFLSETAKEFGNVFLPCCTSYEKDGTFMNSERRVQRVRQCLPVIGQSKPDWQIIKELATHMGYGSHFNFASPAEIWSEVQRVWKPGAGISYDRIEENGLQWPCPTADHPGTTILHTKNFPIGDLAKFSKIEYFPTLEVTNSEYPYLLNTGRTLAQFNAGTMTERTDNNRIRPTDRLEMNPDDAQQLHIEDGESVRIASRYGSAVLPVWITPTVNRTELFATFHDPRVFMNRVTSSFRDRVVSSPEYKVTAVRIERLLEASQN